MVIDKRKQKREIIIRFEREGYDKDLDNLINLLIQEIPSIITQNKFYDKKTSTEITIK